MYNLGDNRYNCAYFNSFPFSGVTNFQLFECPLAWVNGGVVVVM